MAIAKRFKVGDSVRLSADALENENYSAYHDAVLKVASVSTRYMPASEFFERGKPDGYHPGFDSGSGSALYDLSTLDGAEVPFSLYDWELRWE